MLTTPLNPPSGEDGLYMALHQSPKAIIDALTATTASFHAALTSYWPKLHQLPPDKALDYMAAAISIFSQQLTTPQCIQGEAVRKAAMYILEDYGHLNLADVVLCLKMGIKGQLTEYYGRLDAQVLYDWFYHYNITRASAERLEQLRKE